MTRTVAPPAALPVGDAIDRLGQGPLQRRLLAVCPTTVTPEAVG